MTEQQGGLVIDLLKQILQAQMGRQKPAFLDSVALETALTIEDCFAVGHVGGRSQRLAKVQSAVRHAIETCSTK